MESRKVKKVDNTKNRVIKIAMFFAVIIVITVALLFTTPGKRIIQSLKFGTSSISVTHTTSPRQKFNFNYDWIFSKGSGKNNSGSDLPVTNVTVIPEAVANKPYSLTYGINSTTLVGENSETWEKISLPHTYNDVDTFNNFTENDMNGERSMYSGTAWYKKDFYIPVEYEGKNIYLEFEAARQAAKVFINGVELAGLYENGFIPFGYDLTQYLNYGATNHITVKVDNTYPYLLASTGEPVSWHDSHWHPNYGGLYRNSYLYVVDNIHLTLPLYSFLEDQGTYIYASNITNASADINVDAEVENNTQSSRTLKLYVNIKNASGDYVLEFSSNNVILEAGEKRNIKISDTLTNPIRWSVKYPYLYTAECKLVEHTVVDGVDTYTVVDNNETEIGIRTFRFTNNFGMYLNENYLKLQGWGQKTTNEWAGLGAAYPDWMHDYVIDMMKRAGGNYIRWGHVAGSPTQISSSDRQGLIVIQPGVDGEGETQHGTYTTATYKLRTDSFRDMIIYYRNNPSIFIWELGNQKMPANVAQALKGYVQQYDYGNRTYATPNAVGDYSFNSTEIISSSGTYDNTTTQNIRMTAVRQGDETMAPYVEIGETTQGTGGMNTQASSYKPLVEGEYNRLEARRGVWDIYTEGYANFANVLNSVGTQDYVNVNSESFAVSQVTSYKNLIAGMMHCGGANWIFSDSISHGRIASEVARASGELDAVMLPKEAYYVDQVLFSDARKSYIIGHWNYPVGTIKEVYAVTNTNAATATLTVTDLDNIETVYNGINSSDFLWTFSNVLWKNGSEEVKLYDINGTLLDSYIKTSHKEPVELNLTAKVSSAGLKANGSDVLLIDVELLDQDGDRCITFDGVRDNIYTTFTVNSQSFNESRDNYCIWRGGYNSSIENSTNSKRIYLEAGINRVSLRTTMNAGPITVSASTTLEDGTILTDTITLNSVAVDNTNGYSTEMNARKAYSLQGLLYQGVGNATKPTEIEEAEPNNILSSSAYIENIEYKGSLVPEIAFGPSLTNGKNIYIDENTVFNSVPYRYKNAEYLLLPNADTDIKLDDLITFSTLMNIDVLVFIDESLNEHPEWLVSYTDTEDIVTSSTGTVYRVYKKSYVAGTSVVLGENGSSIISGRTGKMYVVAIKATEKVDNSIFFNERYNGFNNVPTLRGWTVKTVARKKLAMQALEDSGESIVNVRDAEGSEIIYMYKRFAPITGKFKISFKVRVHDQINGESIINNYIRIWLHNGMPPTEITDNTNVLLESYIHENSKLMARIANSSTNIDIMKNISVNTWHEYEYLVNTDEHMFNVKIDGQYVNNSGTGEPKEFPLSKDSNIVADCIIFGSGRNSLNNFDISYVQIIPEVGKAISNIKLDQTAVQDYSKYTKDYMLKIAPELNADEHVTITAGDEYVSHSTEVLNSPKRIALTVNGLKQVDGIDTAYTENYVIYIQDDHINKTELKSLVSYSNSLDINKYTVASIAEVNGAKNVAVEEIANDSIHLNDYNFAIQTLKNKLFALVLNREYIESLKN